MARGAREYVMIGIAGLALLALALPQLVVALTHLPGDRVLFALRYGGSVSQDALAGLAENRAGTLGWWPTADAWRERAAAAFELAMRRRAEGVPDPVHIAIADEAGRQALARAPIDPQGWLRLAWLAWLDRDDAEQAAALLKVSVASGRYAPEIEAERVRLILAIWSKLDGDTRQPFGHQVRRL